MSDSDSKKQKNKTKKVTFWVPIYLFFIRLIKNATLQTYEFVYKTKSKNISLLTFMDYHF